MWFLENFADGGAPFKTEEQDPELVRLLSESLYLYGAYEGAQTPVLRIRLEEKNLASVEIINNEHKRGEPVFTGAYVTSTEGETNLCFPEQTISVDPGFFEQHTADLNTDVHSQLEKIRYALYNFEEDFMHHPPFSPPKSESGGSVEFGGNSLANLASAILYHNLENLKQRTDADGFIHTSYHNAPSWRYNGFGTWVPKANTFYNDFYSRDGARAIMTLLLYGEWEKADKATEFAHEWMMYYPRNGLTLNQKKIPGHFSVMPNKPRIYSEFLTGIGWRPQ